MLQGHVIRFDYNGERSRQRGWARAKVAIGWGNVDEHMPKSIANARGWCNVDEHTCQSQLQMWLVEATWMSTRAKVNCKCNWSRQRGWGHVPKTIVNAIGRGDMDEHTCWSWLQWAHMPKSIPNVIGQGNMDEHTCRSWSWMWLVEATWLSTSAKVDCECNTHVNCKCNTLGQSQKQYNKVFVTAMQQGPLLAKAKWQGQVQEWYVHVDCKEQYDKVNHKSNMPRHMADEIVRLWPAQGDATGSSTQPIASGKGKHSKEVNWSVAVMGRAQTQEFVAHRRAQTKRFWLNITKPQMFNPLNWIITWYSASVNW